MPGHHFFCAEWRRMRKASNAKVGGHWRHIHGWHKPCQVLPIEEDVALDRLGSWVELEPCPNCWRHSMLLAYCLLDFVWCLIHFICFFCISLASFSMNSSSRPHPGTMCLWIQASWQRFFVPTTSFHINDLPSQSCRSWRFWRRNPSLWQPHLCNLAKAVSSFKRRFAPSSSDWENDNMIEGYWRRLYVCDLCCFILFLRFEHFAILDHSFVLF